MPLGGKYENNEREGRLCGLDGIDLRRLDGQALPAVLALSLVRREKPAQVRRGRRGAPGS